MSNYAYIVWIPLLPLVTFLVLGIFGRKYFKIFGPDRYCFLIGINHSFFGCRQAIFLCGWKVNGIYQKIIALKYTWLNSLQMYRLI
jgi:NADH-quinone oxidoreductase subunit L